MSISKVPPVGLAVLLLLVVAVGRVDAQLACKYCVYDAEEDRHVFVLFINCEGGGTLTGEGSCRVCIGGGSLTGSDNCTTEWEDGRCPQYTCGTGGGDLSALLPAIRSSDHLKTKEFMERYPDRVFLESDGQTLAVKDCTGASVTRIAISKKLAADLRGGDE